MHGLLWATLLREYGGNMWEVPEKIVPVASYQGHPG